MEVILSECLGFCYGVKRAIAAEVERSRHGRRFDGDGGGHDNNSLTRRGTAGL